MTIHRSFNDFAKSPLYDADLGFLPASIGYKLDGTPNELAIDICYAQLAKSATFKGRFFNPHYKSPLNWPTIYAELDETTLGLSDPIDQTLILNEDLLNLENGFGLSALTLAHEYSHGWQTLQNVGACATTSLPDFIRSVRLVEGDAVAFQLTVAYENMMNGHPDMWNASIEHFTNANRSNYTECIDVFIKSLERDQQTFFTGEAQNAVIVAWLKNRDRVSQYEDACREIFADRPTEMDSVHEIERTQLPFGDTFKSTLFQMPFARTSTDGTTNFHPRAKYGQFSPKQKRRLERIKLQSA